MSLEKIIILAFEKGYDIHIETSVEFTHFNYWLFPKDHRDGGYPCHNSGHFDNLMELEDDAAHVLLRIPFGGRVAGKWNTHL